MRIIFLFVIIMCLASCSTFRYIFSASPPNNPYFFKKGDSKISGYYSDGGTNKLSGEKSTGFDLQAAYAVGNHWAITTSYFNRRERDVIEFNTSNSPFDSSIVNYQRNIFDIGGGYFTPLNSKKTITLNLFAGIGLGKFSMEDNGTNDEVPYNRSHKSDITKYYIQPSVNFSPAEYVRFSLILKTSFVHYGNNKTSYTAEEQDYFSFDQLHNKVITIGEPAFNVQLGLPKYPWIKIDATVSGATSQFSDDSHLQLRTNNASIGLSFELSKLKNKKF